MTVTASRREVLAFIALQDLPMPQTVLFYAESGVSLTLDSIADGLAWCQLLGADASPYVDIEGRTLLGARTIPWRGWQLQINASELAAAPPIEPLDGDVAARLRDIADQPGNET